MSPVAVRPDDRDDDPRAPGVLVDLGGYRLHVLSQGAGSPAVVLSAGAGGIALDWGLVLPRAAEMTRVYAYDRPGSGWSDAGPVARTLRQEAYEVRMALGRLGEREPFVFAGHSLGGMVGRMLVDLAPEAVAGMVLVDSPHESTRLSVGGVLCRLRERATGRAIPPPQTMASSPPAPQAPAATRREPTLGPPFDRLPPDLQRLWLEARRHEAPYDAGEDYLADEFQYLYEQRERIPAPLGDRPLVVLAGARRSAPPPGAPEDVWRDLQAEKVAEKEDLARLSANSRFIADPTSGHHIHLDNPDLVARTVGDVLEAVRAGGRLAR